jgi:precorrin-2 dehydrogenase / sirohydrochlorin ferrochelatase
LDAFPAYFPLAGRKVVVAGTGEGADAKARLFAAAPCQLVRVEGDAALDLNTYSGAVLVFIADPDEDFIAAAVAAARAVGALINVTDRPQLCDFTTPAIIDRGEVVAAIGTGGASPMLAAMLRNDIEQQVPEGAGRVAALFRQFQDQVRAKFPDLTLRRSFLRAALSGPAAEAALQGDMDRAAELFQQAVQAGAGVLGQVQFVDGSCPTDLLTLRASRALASADLLLADSGSNPSTLAMARRDAERLDPRSADHDWLAQRVGEGKRVVRLTELDIAKAEARDLAAKGFAVEILPSATGH